MIVWNINTNETEFNKDDIFRLEIINVEFIPLNGEKEYTLTISRTVESSLDDQSEYTWSSITIFFM